VRRRDGDCEAIGRDEGGRGEERTGGEGGGGRWREGGGGEKEAEKRHEQGAEGYKRENEARPPDEQFKVPCWASDLIHLSAY